MRIRRERGELVEKLCDLCDREPGFEVLVDLFGRASLRLIRAREEIWWLTMHDLSRTSASSSPRHPDVSSCCQPSNLLMSRPKLFARSVVMRGSWMSYLRAMSSSGKSSRRQIAVVPSGSGANWECRRATQSLNLSRAG